MKVRIVEVSDGKNKHYKLQEKYFLFWNDSTEPEYGMIWPTFDTLDEAENFVNRMYNQKESVVKEYSF